MLLMACVGLVVFIGAIFVMEEELRRIGLFGPEGGQTTAQSQVITQPNPENSPADVVEEVTQEERQALEAILQQMKEK